MQKSKIEINKINKQDFNKYKKEIEKIHNENAFPNNGFLLDEDYITNADLIFVAILDNKIIGYISISQLKYEPDDGDDLWIEVRKDNILIKQLAISKQFQNLGIGTCLLKEVKNYAKNQKISNIYLYAMKENEKAHRFYEKNQFKLSGTWNSEEYKGIKNFQSYFFACRLNLE